MGALCDLPAVELRALLGRRAISPVELMDACLARIEAANPSLNAIVVERYAAARAEAVAAELRLRDGEELPPLFGLPLGVKDLNDVAGLRTVKGSPRLLDNVAVEDERVVAAMRAAGAIVVGKTNVPEMGFGASTDNPVFGPTGNPFDPDRSCGASSGGSAVALAAGMVPLAMGSDFAGSLRTPASFCGTAGFRPSPGTVPYERRPFAWSPLDVLGPMGRCAADMKLLLATMAGFDPRDPLSAPGQQTDVAAPAREIDLGRLRVAFAVDLGGLAPIEARLVEAFRAKVGRFAHLFHDSGWHEPDLTDAYRSFFVLRGIDFVAEFGAAWRDEPETLGQDIHYEMDRAMRLTPADMAWAMAAQTHVFRRSQALFEEIDLLIAPAAAVPPFPHPERFPRAIDGRPLGHYLDWEAIVWGMTMMASPVAAIPCGLGPTGLPFGIQVVGPLKRDGWLLDVAHTLERAFSQDPALARPIPKYCRQ